MEGGTRDERVRRKSLLMQKVRFRKDAERRMQARESGKEWRWTAQRGEVGGLPLRVAARLRRGTTRISSSSPSQSSSSH